MDFDAPRPERNPDQIDPSCPNSPRDAPHMGPFGRVHSVDGITGSGHGAHLDRDPTAMVEHQ